MPDDDKLSQQVFKRIASGLAPHAPSAADRRQFRSAVLEAREAAPAGTRTLRQAGGEWRDLAPGVSVRVLRFDAASHNQTALVRLEPGTAIEGHAHFQEEECFVLEGEILIGSHVVRAGDMHVAQRGSLHATISSPAGALLWVRSQTG